MKIKIHSSHYTCEKLPKVKGLLWSNTGLGSLYAAAGMNSPWLLQFNLWAFNLYPSLECTYGLFTLQSRWWIISASLLPHRIQVAWKKINNQICCADHSTKRARVLDLLIFKIIWKKIHIDTLTLKSQQYKISNMINKRWWKPLWLVSTYPD